MVIHYLYLYFIIIMIIIIIIIISITIIVKQYYDPRAPRGPAAWPTGHSCGPAAWPSLRPPWQPGGGARPPGSQTWEPQNYHPHPYYRVRAPCMRYVEGSIRPTCVPPKRICHAGAVVARVGG